MFLRRKSSPSIQDRSKNNELARTAQIARLESQNAAVNKVLALVGAFLSASDDLLVTVNNAYSEADRPSSEVEVLRKWKAQLAERRDAADSEWRREKRSLGSSCTTYMTEGRVWTLRGLRFSAAPTNSSNALGTGTLGMLPN